MSNKNIINDLKAKITKNKEKIQNGEKSLAEENDLYAQSINEISRLNKELANATARLQSANSVPLSTTQYFNPSLAKDFYNMNGNSLQTNSYLAVRQMLGIVNNKTPGVKQTIGGMTVNNNGQVVVNPNGSAVGLTGDNRAMAGWWLWNEILARINYFQHMFQIECEDKKLLKAVQQYLMDVVLSGYAVISKEGDNYKVRCATNVQLDEDGNLVKYDAYSSAFVINALMQDASKDPNAIHKGVKIDDNTVWGQWRANGYNIWYYVMSYLLNAVDLCYIFWNRARLNKTIVEQLKGNDSTASMEAMNYIDPYQNVVTVNTVGWMNDEDTEDATLKIRNKYNIHELGNGEQTQYSFTNWQLWLDYWDNEIGIRSMPINTNTNRSIANEINPLTIKLSKAQEDFKWCLQDMCSQIKDKWGVEVKINLIDDLLLQSLNPEEASKGEGGNASEQNFDNASNGEGGKPNE